MAEAVSSNSAERTANGPLCFSRFLTQIKASIDETADACRMNEILTFTLGSVALLATPGPTNTLLATSGATRGVKASLPLLLGEGVGYVLAIVTLRAAVGPLIAAEPVFAQILSGLICAYLLYLSLSLWRRSTLPLDTAAPVTLAHVFVTTLLNPKAIVFGFTVLPHTGSIDPVQLAPWLAALVGFIALAGASWIILGAAAMNGLGHSLSRGYQAGAVALLALATLLGTRAAGMA
jgi:threonine/homoserine/homoserine lactone efflux protein